MTSPQKCFEEYILFFACRTLIERIITNPVYAKTGSDVSQIKEFFASMLAMYHYEETVMR